MRRLLALPLLASLSCVDTTIVALDPEFSIGWPLESGWLPGDLERSNLLFGEVTTGQIASIPITLRNAGDAGLRVCDIYLAALAFDEAGALVNELRVQSDPEIALVAPPITTLGAGTAVQVQLRYVPLLADALDPSLHLMVKHELIWDCEVGTGETIAIPIVGTSIGDPVPDIYSKPGVVDFGTTQLAVGVAGQTVLVGNAGPGLLEIGSVTLADDTHFGFAADEVQNNNLSLGGYGFLTVFYNPQQAGVHETELIIASNDPDEASLIVPIRAIADDTPIEDPPGDDDDSSPPPSTGGVPIAVCGGTLFANPLEVVTLSSLSFHTGGFGPTLSLQYAWTLTRPPGSITTLAGATTNAPSTSPYVDLVGTYTGHLTVTDSAGLTSSCTQDVIVLPPENFRVELFWDQQDDFDLHLLRANDGSGAMGTPNTGGDCYFGNCQSLGLDWGVPGDIYDNPYLDLDDIGGLGPENINITDPALAPYDGWYRVMVHDYSGSTTDNLGTTNGTLSIYLNQVLAQTYGFSMSGDGNQYWVAKIHWPSGQVQPCNGLSGCP